MFAGTTSSDRGLNECARPGGLLPPILSRILRGELTVDFAPIPPRRSSSPYLFMRQRQFLTDRRARITRVQTARLPGCPRLKFAMAKSCWPNGQKDGQVVLICQVNYYFTSLATSGGMSVPWKPAAPGAGSSAVAEVERKDTWRAVNPLHKAAELGDLTELRR